MFRKSSQKLKQMFWFLFLGFYYLFLYFAISLVSLLFREIVSFHMLLLNALSMGRSERKQGSVTAHCLSLASAMEGRSFPCPVLPLGQT